MACLNCYGDIQLGQISWLQCRGCTEPGYNTCSLLRSWVFWVGPVTADTNWLGSSVACLTETVRAKVDRYFWCCLEFAFYQRQYLTSLPKSADCLVTVCTEILASNDIFQTTWLLDSLFQTTWPEAPDLAWVVPGMPPLQSAGTQYSLCLQQRSVRRQGSRKFLHLWWSSFTCSWVHTRCP